MTDKYVPWRPQNAHPQIRRIGDPIEGLDTTPEMTAFWYGMQLELILRILRDGTSQLETEALEAYACEIARQFVPDPFKSDLVSNIQALARVSSRRAAVDAAMAERKARNIQLL